jgi:hypothetical protein
MLRSILVAAGTIAVIVAEKAPHVAHAHTQTRVIVGVVFALPFVVAVVLLQRRAEKAKTAAAPAQRAGYPFGMPGRRG